MTRKGYRPKDLTGQTFGILTCIAYSGKSKSDSSMYLCKCKCGVEKLVAHSALVRGQQSCGCIARKNLTELAKTHGLTKDPLYSKWCKIKNRCFKKNHKSYHCYGGRGITLFSQWVTDFKSFYDYITKELGPCPEGCSLDRIDNNKNYEPGNLRWASGSVQSLNKRPKENKYGIGVRLHTRSGLYKARISHNKKRIELGYFKTPEEASAAYKKASLELNAIVLEDPIK